LSNDPLVRDLDRLQESDSFWTRHKTYDALRAVLDLRPPVEDPYDRDGYDKAEGYNEALADVREAISRALRVEQ
jgi:hypothetical protein